MAHAVYSRELVPDTVIGSGTASSESYREVGSSCIAERHAIELMDEGVARNPHMAFGDKVRMEARLEDGLPGPFGVVQQTVARSPVQS
ncbi:hypothetical protein [Sphaerotilus hippei]|uniref:hypothetical protein n=1 Tax=Sphaerotilus hippei TaxID=744406 RepID=UPI002174D2A4|nr:hypothetical protein [Sphaerotilus hippei]